MSKQAATPKSFEAALTDLEGIVEQLETGSVTLEQALEHYHRGVSLLRFCQETLDRAEQKLSILDQDTLVSLTHSATPNHADEIG